MQRCLGVLQTRRTCSRLENSNGGLMTFAGGISLKGLDGTIYSAVGVSGGAVPRDREIARAGAANFTV